MECKISGIGPATEKCLTKLNIETLEDLIRYYPKKYYDLPKPVKLNEASGKCAVIGAVKKTPIMMGKVANITIFNNAGSITATWFHLTYSVKTLKINTPYVFYGNISFYNGKKQIVQPEVYPLDEYIKICSKPIPVYRLTKGLTNNKIHSVINNALKVYNAENNLPDEVIKNNGLLDLKDALYNIHNPKDKMLCDKAMYSLKFEELYCYFKELYSLNDNEKRSTYVLKADMSDIISKLPYKLTKGQESAWNEIQKDLASGVQCTRLVQGDVGCGKTVVAFLTLLLANRCGYQSILMAPTEVLAKQHYNDMLEMIKGTNIKCALLTGNVKKESLYKQIADGDIDIVIGTHAVIQESVEYKNLAVVITDEQHRFGVEQRVALQNKGCNAYHIMMSATPIPRSIGLVMYGDIGLSIIHERPANRIPVKNAVINKDQQLTAWKMIYKQIQKGHQAYIICPMVEENENMESVEEYVLKMKSVFPKDVNIGMVYGKSKDKDKIMSAFEKNEYQILVSTTVIEVGVNVPNATVIMIEDSNRFGLSQLHQLRGRVGRGRYQSYCIFVNNSDESCERLQVIASTNDGFVIAEEDLRLRGMGDLKGIQQSGVGDFLIADIYKDKEIVDKVIKIIKKSITNHL